MIHSRDRLAESGLKLQIKMTKRVRMVILFLLLFPLIYTGCSKPIPADDTVSSVEDTSSWSEPVPVTTSPGFNSYQISMDKNGTAILVYSRWDDTKSIDRVIAKVYNPESGWGEDVLVDAGAEMGDSISPFVAWDISDSGSAFITFSQGDGTNDKVYVRRYKKGSGWDDTVTLLSLDDGRKSGESHIAFDSSGNAMAVFTHGEKLYASRFNTSGSWSAPEMISFSREGDVKSPRVIFNGNGQFVISFYQHIISKAPNRTRLFVNSFDGNSWWPVPYQIDTDYINYFDAIMGADGFGNLMLAFSQGASNTLYVKRYFNKKWNDEKKLGYSSGKPVSIAYDIYHNAYVLFVQNENGASHIFSSIYTSSSDTWNDPVLIDGSDNNSADNPRIIFDSLNRGMAIFTKEQSGVSHIFSARFDVITGWQIPERIDGNVASQDSLPEIVTDWEGNALILYASPDPVSGQIYAVKYSSGTGY